MDILIIFSENKKTLIPLLLHRLKDEDIHPSLFPLPSSWKINHSQELLHHIEKNTHSLFLISQQDLDHPSFLFSFGYCLGSHEKSYLLDLEGEPFPDFWLSRLGYTQTLDESVEKIQAEKIRFQKLTSVLMAKKQLTQEGFDITTTALTEAVIKGDHQAVELFIQAEFFPNQIDKQGVSLLCLAVRNNHLNVVETLLWHGADVNQKSQDRDNTPLMDAAAEGHSQMVQALIHHGAQLNNQSRNGQTALILAIGKGDETSAKLLIEAGADALIADKLDMNALSYAQLFGKQEILELIEKHKK